MVSALRSGHRLNGSSRSPSATSGIQGPLKLWEPLAKTNKQRQEAVQGQLEPHEMLSINHQSMAGGSEAAQWARSLPDG